MTGAHPSSEGAQRLPRPANRRSEPRPSAAGIGGMRRGSALLRRAPGGSPGNSAQAAPRARTHVHRHRRGRRQRARDQFATFGRLLSRASRAKSACTCAGGPSQVSTPAQAAQRPGRKTLPAPCSELVAPYGVIHCECWVTPYGVFYCRGSGNGWPERTPHRRSEFCFPRSTLAPTRHDPCSNQTSPATPAPTRHEPCSDQR